MKGKKEPDWVKNEENITEKIQAIEDSKNNFESECKSHFLLLKMVFKLLLNRWGAPSEHKNSPTIESVIDKNYEPLIFSGPDERAIWNRKSGF